MVKRYVWFAAALIAQIGILAALPLGREESGRRIWLSAKVTNLRDVMRGSGIRLDYDVARLKVRQKRGETVYVSLSMQLDSTWTVQKTFREKPQELSAGNVLIRGKVARRHMPIHVLLRKKSTGEWKADSVATGHAEKPFGALGKDEAVAWASIWQEFVDFGISYSDVPERERERIIEDIRKHPDEFAALVQIDPNGRASLLGFRIRDREHEF
ncbi:MAG: GDYXXLXY domain-containing protein [Gemmatimonadota bacterium]|nr:GDYXXLXY domain-containing protein [Gemmatimonadota bacterium]